MGGRVKKILGTLGAANLANQWDSGSVCDPVSKNEADLFVGSGLTMIHDLCIMTSCFL